MERRTVSRRTTAESIRLAMAREPVDERPPTLPTIALELLTLITDFLTPRAVVCLMATSRSMYHRTMPALYSRDARTEVLALRWACHYGVLATAERSLQHGADADAYFPDLRQPPAWNRATDSHPTTMARDGDLLYPPLGDFYDTPLITAIRRKQSACVRLLIARGADVNRPDRARSQNHISLWYPIHWALEPHEVALKRNRDALFRVPNAGGWSIPVGDLLILQYLIDAGANVNQRTTCPSRSTTALLLGEGGGSHGVGAGGGASGSLEGAFGEVWTPLYCAMSAAVPDTAVELLLRAGADPALPSRHVYRTRRERMRTPFDAILNAFPTSLNWKKADHILRHRLLCGPGAARAADKRVSWVDDTANTVSTSDGPTTEHAKPLNRNLTSRPGVPLLFDTILSWADHRPRVEVDVVVGLLKSIIDSDPSAIDAPVSPPAPPGPDSGTGQTALRLACTKDTRLDMRPVIRLLVTSGADPGAKDAAGATALHYAAQFGRVQRARELLARTKPLPAKPTSTSTTRPPLLHLQVPPGTAHTGRPRTLLPRVDVNTPDALGWTPLHYAAQFADRNQGPKQAVAIADLIAAGADVAAANAAGQTALHVACRAANAEAVRALLEHERGGAEAVRRRDGAGRTPLASLLDLVVVYTRSQEPARLGTFAGGDEHLHLHAAAAAGGEFVGPRQYDGDVAASEKLRLHVAQSAERAEGMLRARLRGEGWGGGDGEGDDAEEGRRSSWVLGAEDEEAGEVVRDLRRRRDPRGRRCFVVNTTGAATHFFSARRLEDALAGLPEGGIEDAFVGSLTLGLRVGGWCISQLWC